VVETYGNYLSNLIASLYFRLLFVSFLIILKIGYTGLLRISLPKGGMSAAISDLISNMGPVPMIKVRDIMTKDPLTVSQDTKIVEAARLLLEKKFNGVPVVDDAGALVGIICQSDLISQQKSIPMPSIFTLLDGFIPLKSARHMERQMKKIAAITVAEAMTPDPVTVTPETPVEEAATLMVDRNFHTLPVVDGEKLIGIVGKEDILKKH